MNSRTLILRHWSFVEQIPVAWFIRNFTCPPRSFTFFCCVLLTALLLFLSSSLSQAQQTTGNLQGRLVDSLGQAVSNANIIVSGPNVQGVRGGTSGEDGSFNLLALPTGIVSVSISHVQYQPVILENVSIELGRTTSLGEVQLRSRMHDLPEVVVSGLKPLIDPSSTSSGANLRSSDFQYLPVERNYRSIATLIPQANVSYLDDEVNFAGATGRESKYFVDGVDVTDPSFSKVGTNLPYNFIKEIDVTIGGYEAEYRSTLGGLINVITYSGSNDFHGSAFGFFTSSGLAASRRGGLLDPTQGAFSNYDAGFGIGGPILRDELWFYVAYNPSFNKRDVELPGLGTYVDEAVIHSFAGKMTWRASKKLNLVFTATGDPTIRKAVGDTPPGSGNPVRLENPDPYLTDQSEGGVNVALNGSYMPAEEILLEASLSLIARDETWRSSTELGRTDTILIDTETGVWSGGGFGHLSFFRSGTTGRTSAILRSGSHTLKGGFEYKEISQDVDLDFPVAIYRHSDTLYTFLANGTRGIVRNRILSAYLQDGWQISQGLYVHAGLRWDGQLIIGGNGMTVHTIDGPIQPRVGFVYLPDHKGTQKVFGSFGRFTQEWSSAVMTTYTGTSYFRRIKYDQDPRVGGFSGDTLQNAGSQIPDETFLRGQHYDEISLGYERMLDQNLKVGIQGTYRTFREAINVGIVQGVLHMGNPGRGILSDFPKPRRDYAALALIVERVGSDHFNFLASYVLSRNYGNYEGLYDSYNKNIVPNVNFTYADLNGLKNATGLLPNDRTHVFKFSGSYRFDSGLIVGTSFIWQTGTPLSEVASFGSYLSPRGSIGRTPTIWDLNARLSYLIPLSRTWQVKLMLDAYHIASRLEAVDFVQQHYFVIDQNGNPEGLNPNYGMATRYQPPMSMRLGMEVSF